MRAVHSLRPVPALRRAHVRQGQGPQGRPHADGDVLSRRLDSEALIARVQALTEQLEEVQDLQARAVADELVASIMQLYGEGLERIFAALDEDAPRDPRPARRGRGGREPDADPRPLPGRPRDAGARGARDRAALHGVARRRRRAGRRRGRRGEARGSSGTARAAPRRRRRSRPRSRRRSRRPRPTSTAWRSRACVEPAPTGFALPVLQAGAELPMANGNGNGAPPAWTELEARRARRPARTAPITVARRRPAGRQRRRHAARLPQRVRLVRRAAGRRADDAGRDAHVPGVRAPVRAAPRRALARRRAAARSRRCRCCAARAACGWRSPDGRPRPVARRRAAGASRASRRAPSRRRRAAARAAAASSARSRWPTDHKHLLDLEERRIVCVCPTCWSMRSGEARYRPTGSRTRLARGARALRRAVGRVPDPDRPRVLHALDRHGRASSACTRARRARPSASSTSTPGTGSSPPTRCWRTSTPTPRR